MAARLGRVGHGPVELCSTRWTALLLVATTTSELTDSRPTRRRHGVGEGTVRLAARPRRLRHGGVEPRKLRRRRKTLPRTPTRYSRSRSFRRIRRRNPETPAISVVDIRLPVVSHRNIQLSRLRLGLSLLLTRPVPMPAEEASPTRSRRRRSREAGKMSA